METQVNADEVDPVPFLHEFALQNWYSKFVNFTPKTEFFHLEESFLAYCLQDSVVIDNRLFNAETKEQAIVESPYTESLRRIEHCLHQLSSRAFLKCLFSAPKVCFSYSIFSNFH